MESLSDMRGDQLARRGRIVKAIGPSPNGITVAEPGKGEETGIRTIYRDLEALQAAGFPLYTEKVERASRWAFSDTFKFKIPPPFTLTYISTSKSRVQGPSSVASSQNSGSVTWDAGLPTSPGGSNGQN